MINSHLRTSLGPGKSAALTVSVKSANSTCAQREGAAEGSTHSHQREGAAEGGTDSHQREGAAEGGTHSHQNRPAEGRLLLQEDGQNILGKKSQTTV